MTSNGRFVDGQIPWNKGLAGYSPAGTETGRFKSGQKSHRWVPIGTEKVNACDGYLERKVSDTGNRRTDWQKVHKLMWEAQNGPVPPGHTLRFRDGDKSNVVIENLELLTRAEAIERNSMKRLPAELQEVIRLKQRITRKINEHDC
ncbi:HNH endonuclease signature motif containing protein [Burkholderia seminalis]|uniref:HNH endonuclease signature motif containing protein n=1 Tax=Burkholderia seminalis TaxID=488731 RepID=UPI0019068E59|nr:HNH endonuclease signature motif containing protein [Burkholderia seminalis]MBJ9964462.1 HNH endonuclease [Burkholderia seminalis]